MDAAYQRPPVPDPKCRGCANLRNGSCAVEAQVIVWTHAGRVFQRYCESFAPADPTRTGALARIHAEQLEIFLSRDTTRGSHEIDVLTCAVIIRDKANRLINQWKDGRLDYDQEELLDIANYATIGLFLLRGEWNLPWEVGE